MEVAIVVVLACLAAIFIQDWKYRKIHVVLPLVLFAGAWCTKGIGVFTGIATALNVGFFTSVFGVLILYMTVRKGQFQNPFEHYFGLGDVLFYLSVTPLFALTGYILYFISSMVFALLLMSALRNHVASGEIPLAGFSALLLSLLLIVDLVSPNIKMILN